MVHSLHNKPIPEQAGHPTMEGDIGADSRERNPSISDWTMERCSKIYGLSGGSNLDTRHGLTKTLDEELNQHNESRKPLPIPETRNRQTHKIHKLPLQGASVDGHWTRALAETSKKKTCRRLRMCLRNPRCRLATSM